MERRSPRPKDKSWKEFALEVRQIKKEDRRNGLSYMISGSLALVGGIWGAKITEDPVEQGIYTAFQTIGVASVGYGTYLSKVGGEERSLYDSLRISNLNYKQRSDFLTAYYLQKKDREQRERYMRAITHGLVAALNLYNASQQTNGSIKNGLNFVGGINLLAAISYTFNF